jgi:sortase A
MWPRAVAPPATRGIGRRRPIRRAAAALLAAAGLLLVGQGLFIHAKAALAQVLLERAFAESLARGRPVKPWSWADTWPVARITVPRLGRSAIVLASGSGQALAFGPGLLAHTAEPGDQGISVIAAHRDTHFDFLGELMVGDEIVVERGDGRQARFRVAGSRVVRFDAFDIDPSTRAARLALATCWPIGAVTSGPLRLVVEAELAGG